ncbi:serine/threonine-protein kinase [Kribbella sp. NPDC050470]|uniref:serine/threonine-protein kinase n=1 Tax=unclassified Kribbella TaxID=2644121 RepID=UPI0037B83CAE
MTGEVLAGRYRLDVLLGRGGAGEVWRAADLELYRAVAVKFLHPAHGDSLDQIRAEARKAAQLDHPNVVTVFDIGVDRGRAFMVMELIDGPNLTQVLERGPSSRPAPDRVIDIALQVAAALDVAHAAGIVHCDVKPGNLLLAPDGTIKVSDFGIATAGRVVRRGGQKLVGTPSYVSPEQIRGDPATPASDWYGLGCALYALLTGSPPFHGATDEVLAQHVSAAPVPIRTLRPDVPTGLAHVVMGLLAKNPSERPRSLDAIRRAIQDDTGPARTQVLPAFEVPGTPARSRRRRPILIAAAVAAVLVVAAAIALGGNPGSDTPAAPGTTSATRPTPPANQPSSPAERTTASDPSSAVARLTQLLREEAGGPDGEGNGKGNGEGEGRGGDDGGRDGDVAREAANDLDEVAKELDSGKADKAAGKYRDVRKRLDEAGRDGRWTPTPQIAALLRQLDAHFRAAK